MANSVKAGHALDGFEFSISTGDVVVSDGALDGGPIAGLTLDVSALSLGDGENKVIIDDDGATITAVAAATALTSGQIQLGTFTEATGAATAVNAHNGRGLTVLVTTDDSVSL